MEWPWALVPGYQWQFQVRGQILGTLVCTFSRWKVASKPEAGDAEHS
jgi:hypothetical protein